MNLRSHKVMCNRDEHRSAHNEIKDGEDSINILPNELLIHIVSFLPVADANRTCILSSRWKDIRVFLPKLHLVMPFCWSIEEANKFHDSVDRIFALRGGTHCKSFYLYCSKNCNYDRVYDWLCTAVKCKVEEIELRFPADRFSVNFCWDLFKTSYTLVELTLRGEFELDVPESGLLFPCLKKLNLVSIVYKGDQVLTNLISACPLIQELFVERELIGNSDNMKMFKVSSSSLKRLRISFSLCVREDYSVVIDAPNLEYMNIVDIISSEYTLTKPSSLVEAHIRTPSTIHTEFVLAILPSVKILSLFDATLMRHGFVDNVNIPKYHNLVKFVVGLNLYSGWLLLSLIFESMPNLEHITFSDGLVPSPRGQHVFNMQWYPRIEVPDCLKHKMKKIRICNKEAITREQFPLIRYLLKHSNHLETLSINAHKVDPWIREQLLQLPRGSALCRIELL